MVAFNARPEGDEDWFPTRKARDCALDMMRAGAIARGLSVDAANRGIVRIKRHVASESGAAWLREIEPCYPGHTPGIAWHGSEK